MKQTTVKIMGSELKKACRKCPTPLRDTCAIDIDVEAVYELFEEEAFYSTPDESAGTADRKGVLQGADKK